MSADTLLTVLHISDFHFTRRRIREQEIVVDALIGDLQKLCIGHRRPDIVMFTGDLTNAGGADSHDEAYDVLLSRVAVATGCSDERMFITPGNHDVARLAVEQSRATHIEFRSKAADMGQLNGLYEAGAFGDLAAKKFKAYFDLECYLSDSSAKLKNVFCSLFYIAALNVDVIVFNTALLSSGGDPDVGRDEGKLAVSEYAVLEVLKGFTHGSYRVFATHHPLAMLNESSARYLKSVIDEYSNLHVYGHMHDPQAASTTSFKGEVYSDQAGAVFTQRRGAYIGYSLISLDRSTRFYESYLRTYFDDRKAFDEALDIVEHGKFYSSQQAREFWRGIATPVDDAEFRRYLSTTCLTLYTADFDQSINGRSAHEMFVAPPIRRAVVLSPDGDKIEKSSEEKVSFEEVRAGDGNVILFAAPEFGRTSVLRELQHRLLSSLEDLRLPRLPIFVDFGDIKQNSENMFRMVKGRSLTPSDGFDVESLMKLGHVCLLIDDVVFTDSKRMTIFREFVVRFPKIRYIMSSAKQAATRFGANVTPEMPIHFELLELCALRRREMRQLIVKYDQSTDVDVMLDRLQSEFKEINIPFTAANGSILIEIYAEQSNFRPINRSVLIEQFIDATLRKAADEQSRRATFDYANKTALLATVASWMAVNDDYIPSVDAVRMTMKAYLDRLGLNASVNELMTEFLSARIFINRSDDRLSFRYRAVLEYFIALQMRDSPNFKSWVMDDRRYLTFINEIQYYAGKLRNDADLVDDIGARFTKILQEVVTKANVTIDLNQMAGLQFPPKDEDSVSEDFLTKQLSIPPLTAEERDEELQADIPRDVEDRQEVFRPPIEDIGQQLLLSLLLYSGVVKNMEMIDDTQKRAHLEELWRGWATFLHFSLGIVTELVRHRRIRINGVLYIVNAPHGMTDAELVRAISVQMPTGISELLSATLGTEKLERQLLNVEPASDAPLIYEFFRVALVADLRLAAVPRVLSSGLDRLRKSSYLSEALITKISYLRRLDRLKGEHFEEIAPALATAIADLKGGSRKSKEIEKRRQLEHLKRQGLLLRIRRQSEGEK